MKHKDFPERRYLQYLSAPFIYGMIFPLLLLDITGEIYHRICFPLYGIKTVKRDRYIKIDRQKLSKLRWYEKFHCVYCGYANGLMHYMTTIVAETEKYWCGVKHRPDQEFIEPAHHAEFEEYEKYL